MRWIWAVLVLAGCGGLGGRVTVVSAECVPDDNTKPFGSYHATAHLDGFDPTKGDVVIVTLCDPAFACVTPSDCNGVTSSAKCIEVTGGIAFRYGLATALCAVPRSAGPQATQSVQWSVSPGPSGILPDIATPTSVSFTFF